MSDDINPAASVATDMNDVIRDLLFDAWDFLAQGLRVAYLEESSDPANDDRALIEVVDKNRDRWRIDITVTAVAVGNVDDGPNDEDESDEEAPA